MADNFVVKDGGGANLTVRSRDVGSGVHAPYNAILSDEEMMNRLVGIPVDAFTRPADTAAYAVGDLVANSTTAGSVTALSFSVSRATNRQFTVRRVRLQKSTTSLTNAQFRVHLYRSVPTFANGDNSAWLTTLSGYFGSADITVDRAFSDGARGTSASFEFNNLPVSAGTTISACLEARAAYTPGNAEVFTIELEVWKH